MPRPSARRTLAALIPSIYQIARSVCARNRVGPDEQEDFESFIFAVFLERNCRVLRQFRGEGPLAGYLRVVIRRLLLDYRIQKWGKWRPSAQARRLGHVAMELERLIERDGFSRGEAVRHLRINRRVEESELELLDLAARLPHRVGRRLEGEEALEGLPSPCTGAERVDRCETHEALGRVRSALGRALAELAPDERRLVAQRYEEGLTVAEIARRSGEDQRRLYRRLERLLRVLRDRLLDLGVDRAAVRAVVDPS